MKLILIRHPAWNKKNDLPTEETEKQIKKIIEKLKEEKIDIIYSSPTKRALYLAEKISKKLKVPLVVDDLLKERNEGIYKDEEILERKAKELGMHYVEYRPPNGESVLDVLERTKKFLEKVKGENIVVVTHYMNILCFYSLIKGVDIREIWDKEIIDPNPGEIVIIEK